MPELILPPYVRTMVRWARCAAACLVLAALLPWDSLAGLLAILALACSCLATWVLMFMAGYRNVNGWYATRNVLLSIVLTPVLFIGIWGMALLVRSDLIKRQHTRGSQAAPAGTPGNAP